MLGNIPFIAPPRNIVMEGNNDKVKIFESEGTVVQENGAITIEPNLTNEYEGFYVSFNRYEPEYGRATTALVLGQMQRFYILNGDHTKQYKELIPKGFSACLDYYASSSERMDKFSDKLPSILKEDV